MTRGTCASGGGDARRKGPQLAARPSLALQWRIAIYSGSTLTRTGICGPGA